MAFLPEDLTEQISALITRAGVSDTELQSRLLDAISELFLRKNHELREQVLNLGRDFAESAKEEELDYGGSVAAYSGEETCLYIAKEMLKADDEHRKGIEDFIQDFNKEDDPPLSE